MAALAIRIEFSFALLAILTSWLSAHKQSVQERKLNYVGIRPDCDCYTGVFGSSCGLRESVEKDAIILVDPSWDDYQSTDTFEYMEKLICEEMWNIFGAKRARCKLLHSRSNSSMLSMHLVKNKTKNSQKHLNDDEMAKSKQIKTPVESKACSCSCRMYEHCVSKGVGYRCECKLYTYKTPHENASYYGDQKCYLDNKCGVEDCYACGCQLFHLGSQCQLHARSILVIALIFVIPVILCIGLLYHWKLPQSMVYIRVQ